MSKDNGAATKKQPNQDEMGPPVDPWIAMLAGVAGIDDLADIDSVKRTILELVKKGAGAGSGGTGDSDSEGASAEENKALVAAMKEVGLPADAKLDTLIAKIGNLKSKAQSADAMQKRVEALEAKVAGQEMEDLLRPYKGRVLFEDDANKEDFDRIVTIAKDRPEHARMILDERVRNLPPSGTSPPPPRKAESRTNDDDLIAEAMKEHDNDYGEAIAALQVKMKAPFLEQGYSNKSANEMAAKRHPKIFEAVA